MQPIFFVFIIAFFGGAFAAPKAAAWYDSSSSSYTSSSDDGFPFGYTGAFASAGPWLQFGYPYGFFNHPLLSIPWPVFRPTKPWYEGDNVCSKEEIINLSEEAQSWFGGFSSKGKSKNCEGNGDKYICIERMSNEEGSKMKMTNLFCCPGSILDPSGFQGCVKKSSDDDATTTAAPTTPVKHESHAGDRFSYVFSSSNRDTTRGSDVEKVPPQ